MVSHSKKFIFLHIPRTGGTSIDETLMEYCEDYIKHETMTELLNDKNKDYFKFTFVRNPWDRFLSAFLFLRQYYGYMNPKINGPFNRFLKRRLIRYNYPRDGINGEMFYKTRQEESPYFKQDTLLKDHDGNIKFDFIGRFENLQEDFDYVCDRVGIKRAVLPHLVKTWHKPYIEIYEDYMIELVAENLKEEIEYFSYVFGK